MKRIFFAIAFLIIAFQLPIHAQSVSINNTGAAANASSIFDVDVSSLANKKGMLAPRITLAQRTAMSPLPAAAQGLLVYQTDGVQGFYYNNSLTTSPNWIFVNNSGTGLAWSQLTPPLSNLNLAHGANTTSFSFDGVTTGSAFSLSSNSLTSGNLLTLSSNSTAGIPAGLSLLNIVRTGVNANANNHAVGIYSTVTNTGSFSQNIGGLFSASGATINYGVQGSIYASSGTGVYGESTSSDAGPQFGIKGLKSGNLGTDDGTGVSGTAYGTGGNNYGGSFFASGATFNTGVLGTTDGNNGNGVYGWNYSTGTGNQYGVRGKKSGNILGTGYSFYGEASGTGANNIGGYFTASGASNNYAGIFDQGIVGIGTITPNASALLHVNIGSLLSKGFLVTGDNNGTPMPNLGAGSRMMYYPGRYAFRVGYVNSTQWDNANVGDGSFAAGINTTASSNAAVAMGAYSIASAPYSFALGYQTTAISQFSMALGYYTRAEGLAATAMGDYTVSSGYASTSSGAATVASADYSSAMGVSSQAKGTAATAMGQSTIAKGYTSTVIGLFNDSVLVTNETIVNNTSPLFIVGNGNDNATRTNAMLIQKNGNVGIGNSLPDASGLLHVNIGTVASKGLLVSGANNFSAFPNLGAGSRLMFYPGKTAFRAGFVDGTQWNDGNVGAYSSALGNNTIANGSSSTALGFQTRASGEAAFASGKFSIANTDYATAMGISTNASAYAATALGSGSSASGYASTAIGYNAIANNQGTVAIGTALTASGNGAIAIGNNSNSSGLQSIALGSLTTASGDYSTAIGYGTVASADESTAMGNFTKAKGFSSTSMGLNTTAVSAASTVMGEGTKSKGYGSTVAGIYNDSLLTTTEVAPGLTTPLFIVGNGTTNATRSNAFVVQKNGKVYVDPSNINDGTLAGNALFFGQYNVTGEAIGSKRTANGNAFGLDFFTAYANRMSIANNGNVGIGTDAPISTLHVKGTVNVFHAGVNTHTGNFWQGTSNIDGMEFVSNGAGDAYIGLQRAGGAGLNLSRASGAGTLVSFFVGGLMKGSISTDGLSTFFNTTSDFRLKENISPTQSGIHTLMEIDVKDYNYKADINKNLQTGFLAQELYKIFPQAVTPGGEDAKTNPWTIDYSKLTPLLVKSIQEQQNEMDALKKENAEMKKQLVEILQRLKENSDQE